MIALVVIDVLAWALIHAGTGYLVHRLPARWLDHDGWLWRTRSWERDGDLYVDVFRVKRWKRFLPEAGGLFRGGFDKASLADVSDDYLTTYVRETRRAELGHLLAAAGAPLFVLWNPWPVGLFMFVYAAAANLPCIVSQRYNRVRLVRVLARRRRLHPFSDSG